MTLQLGSWDELRASIGVTMPSGAGWVTLTAGLVRQFGEVLEWDITRSGPTPGQLSAGDPLPAALSFVYGVKGYWQPGMPPRRLGEPMHAPVPFLEIPAPGTKAIGVSYAQENPIGFRVGEPVSCDYTVLGFRQAETRIGPGAFIDVGVRFRARDGAEVVAATWTIFRYTPLARSPQSPPQAARRAGNDPRSVAVHVSEIDLDLQRLVMWAGVIRDFAPIHFDRRFARSAGAPDAFANTQFILALYERALDEAFGPELRPTSIGPFRMIGFATADHVVRTSVGQPQPEADGSLRVPIWQECDGHLTAAGEARLTPARLTPARRTQPGAPRYAP